MTTRTIVFVVALAAIAVVVVLAVAGVLHLTDAAYLVLVAVAGGTLWAGAPGKWSELGRLLLACALLALMFGTHPHRPWLR
jgi:hypothetical protein